MRSMSKPLALRLCGDSANLSRKVVPVGVVGGGKSCSNSIFIGESAKVTCFSSLAASLEDFEGGGVVCMDSGKVVIVVVV
jgi:hypothetical protein